MMFSKSILRLKFFSVLFILLLAALTSCGKGGDTPTPVSTAPTNLSLDATVSGTSGNVVFKATATNAVMYTFDLGNGIKDQVSVTGDFTYKYATSGVYTVTVVAKSASGASASKTTVVTVTTSLSLIWSDEFDAATASAPDPNKWGYDIGTGSGGWGNNEQEYYTNRTTNSIVSGGTLKITALKESFSGSNYTSARLLSKGKFSFKYGKVDISAKLPAGGGTWPALWMLGDNIGSAGWPACGEIDIMEHWGTNQNVVSSAVHHPINGNLAVDEYVSNAQNKPGVSTDFHIYAMEWDAQKITFSVDGINHLTYNPPVKNQYTWPFNAEQYILLNVAIEPSVTAGFVQSAMDVDYVRVYQQTALETNNVVNVNNLVLFPNPASDEITLKSNENLIGATISISSLLGQKLDSFILNSEETTLNLSNYQSGIYILKVNSQVGIQSYKFIKK